MKRAFKLVNKKGNSVLVFGGFDSNLLDKNYSTLKSIKGVGLLGTILGIKELIYNAVLKGISNIILVGNEKHPFYAFSALVSLRDKGIKDYKIKGFKELVNYVYGHDPVVDELEFSKEALKVLRELKIYWIRDLRHLSNISLKPSTKIKELKAKVKELIKAEEENAIIPKPMLSTNFGLAINANSFDELIAQLSLKISYCSNKIKNQYELLNVNAYIKHCTEDISAYGSRFFEKIKYKIRSLDKGKELVKVIDLKKDCFNNIIIIIRNNSINLVGNLKAQTLESLRHNYSALCFLMRKIAYQEGLREGFIGMNIAVLRANKTTRKILGDFIMDKFGYITLSRINTHYIAEAYEPNGKLLIKLKDKDKNALRKRIIRYLNLCPEHASYIGMELQKLETQDEN